MKSVLFSVLFGLVCASAQAAPQTLNVSYTLGEEKVFSVKHEGHFVYVDNHYEVKMKCKGVDCSNVWWRWIIDSDRKVYLRADRTGTPPSDQTVVFNLYVGELAPNEAAEKEHNYVDGTLILAPGVEVRSKGKEGSVFWPLPSRNKPLSIDRCRSIDSTLNLKTAELEVSLRYKTRYYECK